MKKKDTKLESSFERLKRAATSGGVSGAVVGGLHAALLKGRGIGAIGSGALKGAGLGAAITTAATGAGEALLGAPGAEEAHPQMKRGALGGATLGATAGILGGLALASGKMSTLARMAPEFTGLSKKYAEYWAKKSSELGAIPNKLREYAKEESLLKTAALGGATGAAIGGYQGGDEGMVADTYNAGSDNGRRSGV